MTRQWQLPVARIVTTCLPIVIILIGWQIVARDSASVRFFFSSPEEVFQAFESGVRSGALIIDFGYTLVPTLIGFLLGVVCGTLLGFLLLYSRSAALAAEWNVLILGSIPIFAIAPMTIIWFGIGLEMKVALAFLSTVFVALSHAYRGGRTVAPELLALFTSNYANRTAIFRKLVLPSALDWVLASLRINANLALLGVFVGEYMASEHGLGHAMLRAGSLYETGQVLASALAMMLMIVTLDVIIRIIEHRRYRVIQLISVNRKLLGSGAAMVSASQSETEAS